MPLFFNHDGEPYLCTDIQVTDDPSGGYIVAVTIHNNSANAINADLTLWYADPCATRLNSSNAQPLLTDLGGNGNGSQVIPNVFVPGGGSTTVRFGWTPPDDNGATIFVQACDTANPTTPTWYAGDPLNAEFDMCMAAAEGTSDAIAAPLAGVAAFFAFELSNSEPTEKDTRLTIATLAEDDLPAALRQTAKLALLLATRRLTPAQEFGIALGGERTVPPPVGFAPGSVRIHHHGRISAGRYARLRANEREAQDLPVPFLGREIRQGLVRSTRPRTGEFHILRIRHEIDGDPRKTGGMLIVVLP